MTYRTASRKQQHAASTIRISHLAEAAEAQQEYQTASELRSNLVAAMQSIEARIAHEPNKEKRKALGVQKFELQNQIRAIRPKLKPPPEFASLFMTAAKDRLTRHQFLLIMNDAIGIAKANGWDVVTEVDLHGEVAATQEALL